MSYLNLLIFDQTPTERYAAMTWAQRLKRVFDIDIETCSECGGDVKVIACTKQKICRLAVMGSNDCYWQV